MNEPELKRVIAQVIAGLLAAEGKRESAVPVEVSARHVHLSQTDVEALFGKGHQLTPKRPLSQPGQFLAEERVSIVTSKGDFRNVAVLGPARGHTQVELSVTDAKALGLSAPVRQSGDTAGCPDVPLMAGSAVLLAKEAAMVAQAHIHMTPQDAKAYGVTDGQHVKVSIQTARPVTYDDVVVRVSDRFSFTMHIDFDEANACGFQTGDKGALLGGTSCPTAALPVAAPVTAPAVAATAAACTEKLISEAGAQSLAKTCGKKLTLPRSTIVTPSALDVFRRANISLEREGVPC
ncbi:MAG: phosphate propanoyltransferase [Oscillospiraceae bacterium]